jgi:hypothetical protein
MRKLIFLTFLLGTFQSVTRAEIQIQSGDVILQPMDCWACGLIEAEEETIYSHIGIAFRVGDKIEVAEAFGKVRKITLDEFNKKTQKDQKLKIIRFRNEQIQQDFLRRNLELQVLFETEFNGLTYDAQFLWNNFDSNGNEKLYCSEFISKFLQASFGLETPIKRMHFEKNRDSWIKFFKGNVPDNQWGNSPGDYERSELFYEVGEL